MRTIRKPTPATVISLLALFIAMGGSAMALKGKNTVRSDDIKNKQVKTKDIGRNAVGSKQIKDGALESKHIAPGVITGDLLAPDAVTGDKIAAGAIGSTDIANGAIGPQHLDPATPAAAVTHSADQSIPYDTLVALNFDTEDFDTAGLHPASPSSCLTAPTAGVYDISANVTWAARPNGFRRLVLVKNGSVILGETAVEAVTEDGVETLQNVAATAQLAAGDCVTVKVQQASFAGGPPVPASLGVKRAVGAAGNSPSFTMVYAVPGS